MGFRTKQPRISWKRAAVALIGFGVVFGIAFTLLNRLEWYDMDVSEPPPKPSATATMVPVEPSPAPTTSLTPTSSATVEPEPEPMFIEQSAPVELRIPSAKLHLEEIRVLPKEYRDPIYPPSLYYAYWDPKPFGKNSQFESYGLGTDAQDLAVIAGHSWNKNPDTVFNPLYDWEKDEYGVKVGDELLVRTKKSGKCWLVYDLEKIFTPTKGEGPNSLEGSKEIWGTDAHPRPGHLLVITCKQRVGKQSTRNIVFDFAFKEVRCS